MEKSRSLSIAVRGLFVSAFLSTVFGVASASAFTVTYKSYGGGLFDDGSDTNIVEYDNDKNIVSGEYKDPIALNSCGDKEFTGWFTDKGMKDQYYLRDNDSDVTVFAGYTEYSSCFDYLPDSQTYFVRKNANYQIQLWGASGQEIWGTYSSNVRPGRGAYVSGKIDLIQEGNIYVYVGGNTKVMDYYTFNGGGGYLLTGGGATDIRLVNGDWNNSSSLASRIMVAGGGGGGFYLQSTSSVPLELKQRGDAGGLEGYDAILTVKSSGAAYANSGEGATQTSGGRGKAGTTYPNSGPINGSFGLGGYGTNRLGGNSSGGGGYYGGGIGIHTGWDLTGGGGGSSYISGHNGCIAITGEDDLTPSSDSIHYSGKTFTDTVMIDGAGYQWTSTKGDTVVGAPKTNGTGTEVGHLGTGYAKIGTTEETFHTVTFKHTGEDDFTVYVIDGEKVVRPNIYLTADTGYTLHSWEVDGTAIEWDFDEPVTSDLVLKSYISIDNYSLTYDLNNGSVITPNPATYTIESAPITLTNPTKDYYAFKGWSGTDLTGDENTSVTIPTGSYGDREYTANYTPIPYAISYDLDGGANGANNPTEYNYESNEIVLARPTKEGYTFTGWSGTGIDGEDNLDVTIPAQSHGDREYTAHWSINQYTATFDVNGGTAIDPSTITSDYGVAFGTLPTTSRTGYDFDGWFTEQTSGDKISDATTMPAEDHTYYAHWTIQTFNITYDLNGGELAQGASNPDTYTYESADINLAKPSREGYTFLGWSGTDLTNNTEDVTIAHNSLGNRSYRAEFQINEYTATFDANAGETANPETITKNYDEELGNLPATSRLGYKFLGWFTDVTAGDKITDATKMPAGDVTYYAHWEIINYTIEYDLGGEDMDTPPANDASNPTSYTVEDADITLKAATPGDTWHYFVGWALDRDSEDGLSDNFVIDTAEAKNIKVYAIFQANPYTVTLDPGNGDDEIVKTVRGDQEIGELPTPERAGYEFLGWFVGDKQIDEHFHPRSDSIAVARWEEIPTVPDTGANSTPNTGDAIMNHIVTFAVCIFALFIVAVLRKRKAKNEA